MAQPSRMKRLACLMACAASAVFSAFAAIRRRVACRWSLPLPNPLIRSALDLHPDLAAKVGLVIAEYALLERLMYSIYAVMVLGEVQPILGEVYYKPLKRLWRWFSAAANRRTEIAHCLYFADAETVMRLHITEQGGDYVPLSTTIFERTFSQYHTLGTDLLTFAAIVAPSRDRMMQVLHVLPRPPSLKPPPEVPDSQGQPTQSEIDEQRAECLHGLRASSSGLPRRFQKYLRITVRQVHNRLRAPPVRDADGGSPMPRRCSRRSTRVQAADSRPCRPTPGEDIRRIWRHSSPLLECAT